MIHQVQFSDDYDLEKLKDRVRWIYDKYQDAVESDDVLLAIYDNYARWHNYPGSKFREDSIKRAGRYYRSLFPARYSRSEEKRAQDMAHQIRVKEVFA